MRDITVIYTIASISILIVGYTGCLPTSPFRLRPCMCTIVLPRFYVLVRISDILRRFSLGCQSCMDFSLDLW